MRITINEETTFLISDELGDVPAGTESGLYHEDTRFLSYCALSVDGRRPLLLAGRSTDYHEATHFLSNPVLDGVGRGRLGIRRTRMVGRGMHEDLDIVNHGGAEAAFTLELSFAADFADIFTVKRELEMPGAAGAGAAAPTIGSEPDGRALRFEYRHGTMERGLRIEFTESARIEGTRCRFPLRVEPHGRWHLCIDYIPLDAREPEPAGPMYTCRQPMSPEVRQTRRLRREAMAHSAPLLETDAYVLGRAYEQSAADFAALRLKGEQVFEPKPVIAAGIPWFMALFGRDSLIAAYQALPLYPDLARGVLRALARLQGTRVDPIRAEEPGKIVHEYRDPALAGAAVPAFPYYGTVDATPLFLILLAATVRATGDLDLARDLYDHAGAALEWMRDYGDRDGDGYIEYGDESPHGSRVQGWKDSEGAIRFRDGRIATPPIALCEVQGYAYAARLGMAEVFEKLDEPERAGALREQAEAMRERFERDFWLEDRGVYALALDGEKRPVDALTSNPGQLLWTGIVAPDRARRLAERLLTPDAFSGWGIRTMAASEGGYNPISYHNGTVWPHDNSLIVLGLARYGLVAEATEVARGLLDALEFSPDHRFPELFAGYGRAEVSFPVEFPTACRPQAWASGSIFLLVTTMLGYDLSAPSLACAVFLPPGIDRIRVEGLRIGGRRIAASIARTEDGGLVQEERTAGE